MEKFRFVVAAAGALAIGALAAGSAQAAVLGGTSPLRAGAEMGAIAEQVQFRFGEHEYCWADDGWRGPGWYWCGYAYRPGFGWGGPVGWNNWRWVGHDRDHREIHDRDDRFRDHDDRGRDRDHDRDHDRRF
jgi:hypothetical protein